MEGCVVHGYAPALKEAIDYGFPVNGAIQGLSNQATGLACLGPGFLIRIVVYFGD